MKYKILLFDKEDEYGKAMELYFTKRKIEGELDDWDFKYLGNEDEGILETNENQQVFVLVGAGFTEKDILLELQKAGAVICQKRNNFNIGLLTEDSELPFYRFGGIDKILKNIEQSVLGKSFTSDILNNEAMIIMGVGLTGGAGNTTILLEINEALRARGFKTAYIDLNYWGNTNDYIHGEKMLELSYLRFILQRDTEDFEGSFLEILRENGKAGSILIDAISETDCHAESLKQETGEIVRRLAKLKCFDFILLDGNKYLLADGRQNNPMIAELILTDCERGSISKNSLMDRVSDYYIKNTKTGVIKVINKAGMSDLKEIDEGSEFETNERGVPVFRIMNWFNEEKEGGRGISGKLSWGKGVRKQDSKKIEKKEGEEGGQIADYLIRRWMSIAKQ